jgi:hypothetical protein
MPNDGDNDENERKLRALVRRPTAWVALIALVAAGFVFYASVQHDYGKKLPFYALELPLLLHFIHAGIAFAIVGFAGNWAVQNLRGTAMEEGGVGPFRWAFGKTSKAIHALRDAVEKLDERQRQTERRVTLVQEELARVKVLRGSGDGEVEPEGSAAVPPDSPGRAPTAEE